MCITCNVKVKGLCWLKVALYFMKEQTIMCYFVAAVLQKTRESCDEIPSGSFRWISLGTFHPNYDSYLVCFPTFFVFVDSVKFWMKILFPPHFHLSPNLVWPTVHGLLEDKVHWVNRYSEHSAYTTKAVSPLDQTGLSVSVRLSCGRAGGNLKVLWKTKSGPAAAASCWPTLFRGSRYRLMTGLLLSGPHY